MFHMSLGTIRQRVLQVRKKFQTMVPGFFFLCAVMGNTEAHHGWLFYNITLYFPGIDRVLQSICPLSPAPQNSWSPGFWVATLPMRDDGRGGRLYFIPPVSFLLDLSLNVASFLPSFNPSFLSHSLSSHFFLSLSLPVSLFLFVNFICLLWNPFHLYCSMHLNKCVTTTCVTTTAIKKERLPSPQNVM